MAEYFVGPVMDKLIDACSEYFKDQVGLKTDVEEELKKLRFIHPQIQAVVSAYKQAKIEDPNLNKWLWQLRDAIDEADDVLDEFEYWKLEKPVIDKNKGKRRAEVPVWNLYENLKRTLRIGRCAPKSDPNLERLKEAVHKLHEISAQVSTFLHLLDRANQQQQQQQLQLHATRETGSLIKNVLIGRSKEMDFVSGWLRNPNETQNTDTTDLYRNISLLSVVGHGGMGKTSLLQHVYNKDATHFDVQMWVCVSTNFDSKTVIKNILESLKNERPNLESLDSLQKRLRSEVKSKRFLLMLDDIWEADEEKWKDVFAALQDGNQGSKILISTRIQSVANMFANIFKNSQMYQLEGLEKDDCLQLFKAHAFAGGEIPDGKFRDIAEKIIEKLSRCPLGVKFIANFLKTCVNETFWTNVLNSNIANIKSSENGLLAILKLSYTHLPSHLQNCFSFCCIFPQDYKFNKDHLILMWIALGFIQSSNISGETPEDTGKMYFTSLVQNSFFDEFHNSEGKVYYKMHDLLHELAQSVSAEECFRIEDDLAFSIPKTTRHLSIDGTSCSLEAAFKQMGELKNLRSLILSFGVEENVIYKILKASESIRLLVLDPHSINYNLSENIGCLIHLRCLKVEGCRYVNLPRSISHLYHLQFIISLGLEESKMNNIGWKESMPNENCQLILRNLCISDPSVLLMEPVRSKIRYLRILRITSWVSFPSETEQWFQQHSSSLLHLKFDNLQSQQSLPSLSTFSSLRDLRLWKIPLLKSLPDLPSSLEDLNLRDLESLHCLPSSFLAISSITNLTLNYSPLLKSLPDLPSSLKYLYLRDLESLQCLPSFLSTISSLKILRLYDIPLLKSLTDLPSSLKELELNDLKSLQFLPSSLLAISSLTNLTLEKIPLKSLPDLPSSLKTLNLGHLESLQCLSSSLSTISSLEILRLYHIPLLKSFTDLPSSLKKLDISNLTSLQSLPSSLSTISSLEILYFSHIPLLKSLPDLPSSLKDLKLKDLESLHCLPSSFLAISSITNLTLNHSPLLKSLPDLPSSLKYLYLRDLESLQCLPSSLSTISSLEILRLHDIPLLKSLTDLPSSLKCLELSNLTSLQSLPSSLSAISSLMTLTLRDIPLLKSLPDLPASLEFPSFYCCDPQLMERYKSFRGRTQRINELMRINV